MQFSILLPSIHIIPSLDSTNVVPVADFLWVCVALFFIQVRIQSKDYRYTMLEHEKTEYRDFVLNQTNSLLEAVPKDHAPIRVVGQIPTNILNPEDCLASIRPFVTEVQVSVGIHCAGAKTCFVAAETHSRYTFFVVDINNVGYNYDTAHQDSTAIPVFVLRLSRRPSFLRDPKQDQYLAQRLANMHRAHGDKPLPLFDNFTKHIEYGSPRGLRP